jgi:hypothetical protein
MAMNTGDWKGVTKAPAALKSKPSFKIDLKILAFKRDLRNFREEMTAKKQSFYIPVTMDELMARFVTNMERNDCKDRFRRTKKELMGPNVAALD